MILRTRWLFYDKEQYDPDLTDAPAAYAWGTQYNFVLGDFIKRKVSSVRHAGPSREFDTRDTLTVYQGDYFKGQAVELYNEQVSFPFGSANSVIVTGCEPWTLYSAPGYNGLKVCAYPGDNCTPSFYTTAPVFGGGAGSMRRGCFAKEKVLPHASGHEGFAIIQPEN